MPNDTVMKVCPVCKMKFQEGRSRCPHCGQPNIIFESSTFIRIEIEMEQALYRSVQDRADGNIEEWIVEAIEARISELNKRGRS